MQEETPNPNGTEIKTPPASSWFIDEGVPGVGDRPAWMSDKFKTVADMARSYGELEKKIGTAPEDYDLSKSKFIDPEYAPFQDFAQFAKEKRVPKDVIDKMIEAVDKYADEFSPNYAEEGQKLGADGPERLKVLDNWAKANLSAEAYDGLIGSVRSADAIKALEELRSKMMSTNTMIPPGNDDGKSSQATFDEIKAELNDPANLKKYKEDPKYQKDWRSRLEMAAKTSGSGFIDKVGA